MDPTNSSASQSVQESPSLPNQSDASLTPAPSAPERISLPARPAPPVQASLSRADLLLAFFVVLLAFLVASTPVRNSDFWLHLATGRAIADGSYRFQGDPFSQDANAWVAHSWLYDLLTYGLFTSLGGTMLVILKALLIAFLAEVLLRLGTRERGVGWPALAVTLSLLAMSGRLLLQPALLSAVLLAVTLWLLQRGRRLRAERDAGWLAAYGPICLLFALWTNLDDWFLLGPLTVGLYLMGEATAYFAGAAGPRADLRGLALLLGAGLLACVLTPFHVHGFTLPPELGLSAAVQALQTDPVLQNLFVSPFNARYYHSGVAWSIPGLAYLLLVILSGLSFLGSREAWRSWRLPVWLGLFALSAWSVRAAPFFAVAAAPILALNVQDWARAFRPDWLRRDEFLIARLGRAASILLLLGLLVSAWPGWLQGAPYEMRRWVVLQDPSLQQAAEKLKGWRQAGILGDEDQGFHFSPEEANYFAWNCPAEKGIVDARLQTSPDSAADYVTVRRALLNEKDTRSAWRDVLRKRRVTHVIVFDNNAERVTKVYRHLRQNPSEWVLLSLTGRTAIFAWKDPRNPVAALEKLAVPIHEAAYHPSEDKKAPASWPGRGPEPGAWWRPFVTARPASTANRDEASLLLLDFELQAQKNRNERSLAWDASRFVGALGSASIANVQSLPLRMQQLFDLHSLLVRYSETPIPLNLRKPTLAVLAQGMQLQFLNEQDDAPPAYLWLSIRAARLALHDNPDDAHAYFILSECYLRLLHGTRERIWTARLPYLTRLRQVQASAALNQALLLNPDLIAAHDRLALLYQELKLWDLCLKHRREVLRLLQKNGPSAGETATEYEARVEHLREEVEALSRDVAKREERLDVNTANYKFVDRAVEARKYGLGGKALEILLSAPDVGSSGATGVGLELDLLLLTGRIRDVREWMELGHRQTLGDKLYFNDRLQLAAASGDYDEADQNLAELQADSNKPMSLLGKNLPPREIIAGMIGWELLEKRLDARSPLLRLSANRVATFTALEQMALSRLQGIADFWVLRGLFAVERGDTAAARTFMDRALETYQSGKGLDFGARPVAEYYLKLLR